ncbi:MAG: tRNA pseudouridine(13) synthase TruD [Neptuniibacter caesariensis]|uniref:tRNA pseudouridine synthase D n=1 Tax=Neptuniibacter caesariensis TaxID=207954 RepID=A0A2G6JNF6_NEPCE|nr:MAG: tRNA pseudouridine(13) synthase TruD [Neptuniibacter caesariensis]
MNILPTNFSYRYGKPDVTAQIRTVAEDFQVVEDLGFEPEGEGEHVFLYIRKQGENTDWVARQLVNFAQISPRDVSYAGKKDRHAVTEQWFCVKFPIKRNLNWKLFGGDSIQVLKAVRHPRKLRLGALKGNRFRLRLRQVSDMQAVLSRAERVKAQGVPNYFGEQRFGQDYGNLEKGLALLRGELQERQRAKKGIYISAVRSWLFNQLLSLRIEQGLWETVLQGDVLMLTGSHSCFVAEAVDEQVKQRLLEGDVSLTGPLWGRGELMSQGAARAWELQQLESWQEISGLLERLSLKQERRSSRLLPGAMAVDIEDEETCSIEFDLISGSFATSVLREICCFSQPV